MKEIKVNSNEANQRMDKLIVKYLNKATKGFIYKMLRKKNIVLNDKKANGNEILKIGDSIKIYLSDETYNLFASNPDITIIRDRRIDLDIVYEDDNLIFVNKPVGMLSQKATKDDVSINEYIIDYLLNSGKLSVEQMKSFKPSICNRLDRNTSGLISAGKTLKGLQNMTAYIKDREVDKFYLTIVKGNINKKNRIEGYIIKDESINKVDIVNNVDEVNKELYSYICTEYEPLLSNADYSLLKVKLITGKTHQIRAHLAYIKHPVIGDTKYGDVSVNNYFNNKYKLRFQLLHSYQMIFSIDNRIDALDMSEKMITARIPEQFEIIIKDLFSVEVHNGILEEQRS